MFENKSTLISSLKNPMIVAAAALDEIENRLGGTRIIADPNTPFCHLLEFGSSIAAQTINAIDEKLPILYPKRATTMEELYSHMSDYDYLRMYSSPAKTAVRMYLPKRYLINHAINYNTNYKKVVIPSGTRFIIGKYNFGIYYPINILINNYTNAFTVIYDTTNINPLFSLTKNVVDKYDINYGGLEYLVIDFCVYQFSKSTVEESLLDVTGFAKKIEYNDKFYALRLYNYKNKTYTEMSQSQSKFVYDTSVPTALVQVLPDEAKIKINIPQIYFDNNLMGSKLLVELYTTEGALDVDTTNINDSDIGIVYDNSIWDNDTYTNIFKNMPFDNIIQLSGTRIAGGSDAISVSELRNRVVNDTLYDKVPISEAELTTYLNDNGFYVSKYTDNITDRRYYAYRVIRDSNGTIVPSFSTTLTLLESYTKDSNHSSFLYHSVDNSITIMPSALYVYDDSTGSATPLTDAETNTLINSSKRDLAETLNTKQYLKSLYYIRVSLDNLYPRADSFDLSTPTVDKITFELDNTEVSQTMMSFAASIVHDVVGKYEIYISVTRSDDLQLVTVDNLKVYGTVLSSDGKWIGTEATYISTDANTHIDTWKLEIPVNYHLTLDDEIGVTYISQDEEYSDPEHLISLTPKFYLVFMASKNVIEGAVDSIDGIVTGVPAAVKAGYVGLTRQSLQLTLGDNLNDVICNNLEISKSKAQYQRYATDIPKRYTEDVYEKDENGYIKIYQNDDGTMSTKKLHEVGEIVKDDKNHIVYEHLTGDVIRDAYGNPVTTIPGEKLYYLDMMFIDAKMFFSDRQAELDFQTSIYEGMRSYLNIIRDLQNQLLERTSVYFNCVRSTGTGRINRGDGVIVKENIELSFRIVCYVPSYVKKSEDIQNNITELTCTAIEAAINTKTISMLDIFESVKSKMSDYIDHFDLLGINDNVALQTFTVVDDDSQPSICRKLELSDDNILTLKKQIDITYISLNDNTADTTLASS